MKFFLSTFALLQYGISISAAPMAAVAPGSWPLQPLLLALIYSSMTVNIIPTTPTLSLLPIIPPPEVPPHIDSDRWHWDVS